ncbi:metal-binding protein ZinT [Celeribacter sp. PS-C1]|uniref:ZinT family metal-binding protein n=1 Tax=Celeribacter sp. PS-C1 TaxID=2820813 RepID=UPI001C667448|nr:metal-binding protein ZinT [Celeribacter sp. PS-C1]MBW6417290.1 metal-binding protein ZinT [Celeribacter sp. PS-C1]
MQKTSLAIALAATLTITSQAQAESHDHDHAQDDKIYEGYFKDSQVAPRPLSDWAGDWQSVYPLLTEGKLDAVMEHKAEHGDKSVEEYTAYYTAGYATDVNRIEIEGSTVTFHQAAGAISGEYEDDGYEILTYARGNRGVRFVFEKVSGDDAAPQFIQFSDHRIFPSKSDHYHLYWGNDRTAVLEELTNWPTYFPVDLTPEQIAADMMAH